MTRLAEVGLLVPVRKNNHVAASFGNQSGSGCPDGALMPHSDAERMYFDLEAFLDNWRRYGMPEDAVRIALERAWRASVAMENVGKLLKGR